MAQNIDEMRGEVRRSLWQLHQLAEELETQFLENEGEVTEDTSVLEAMKDDEIEIAAEACARYISEVNARQEFLKQEVSRLSDAKRDADRRASWVFKRLHAILAKHGKGKTSKIVAGPYTLSMRKSTYLDIGDSFDPLKLPDNLLRYKDPEPDKKLIKAALEAGKTVPGCSMQERRKVQVK